MRREGRASNLKMTTPVPEGWLGRWGRRLADKTEQQEQASGP